MIRVKAGIFSITPPAAPDDDDSYLRWHLLDHMPDQFQLPGIVHAQRWIADGAYLDHRIAANGHLNDVGNVVNYLVGDPAQQTIDDFMELGQRLGDVGRFPAGRRPLLQLRVHALLQWHAAPRALISAEAVPWRPHRGVLVIVEEPTTDGHPAWMRWLHAEHLPQLLEVPGVAGVWTYGSTPSWNLPEACQGPHQHTTVIYVDEDPLTVTKQLQPLIERRWATGVVRPLFAGPLRTMTAWEVWP
jgi:hypothetical protein